MADALPPLRRRLVGVVMIGLVVALLGLCVVVFNKVFTPKVSITMQIAKADNSFLPEAEVRMRGVTVGEVSDVDSDGRLATIRIDLQPGQVSHIPSNVTAALLPKSLFGESYVSLQVPDNPSPRPIQAGDVITPDRSTKSVQTEQVFQKLLPLLEAVRPADLASTLGALSQALTGRGEQLGKTVTQLHQYLRQLNPALPELTQEIQALPKVTDTYSKAAPDLIEGLKNLTTTSDTLVEKQRDFANLYRTVTGTSNHLTDFLRDNRSNLVDLVATARPTLDLLARYSPEYVCLFRRLSDAIPFGDRAFGLGDARPALHITAEIVATRGKFLPHQDEPEITDNRGPACYDNTPPLPQYPGGPAMDGSTHPPASPQTSRLGQLFTGGPSGPAPSTVRPPLLPFLGGVPGEGSRAGSDQGGTR
jgi:virulence factor Mce-like protein